METKETNEPASVPALDTHLIAKEFQESAEGRTQMMATANIGEPECINFPSAMGGSQPINKMDPAFAGAPSGTDSGQSLEKIPHILCVDDERDILSVARLSLETVGGYKVTTCSSGPEAVERIKDINPDLILLDVMMPHMGGPETLQELRSITDAAITPIVFMTARVQPNEVEEYIQMGAAAVVHKPFDPMQLANQIGEILDRLRSH